ncbi:MAG: hypothetical protein B7X07_03580 [Actinobacteria bacterium 21-64-8]|nr:MAG: hypothetical protein B7X07_03580 [Actinobacteria bacterium 21-64-8]
MGRFDQIVRCKRGHLFTTTWVPFASLKAVRLGNRRYQFCPVGRHWSLATRVDPSTLSEDERRDAPRHDVHLP